MADAEARNMQYEYKLVTSLKKIEKHIYRIMITFLLSLKNSNLVLNPNKDLIEKIDRNEPTGEVLPLTSNDTAQRMGDRYQRTKPKLLDDQSKTK
jgi:hypothetical protein